MSDPDDLVLYRRDGAVALLTLNRPPVNALNTELIAAIDAALDEAADPSVRAVVITGNRHFAAGADIKRFVAAFESGSDEPQASGLGAVIDKLEALAKPTIAAVPGFALGGGLELAMGADFRYLADDATVGQPEILLGIIPGAGGTQRLPRLVGYQRAKEMVMSGRQVPAAEAFELGLADKVVPAAELLDVALADAATWAEGPTVAHAAAKASLGGGHGRPLADGLAVEREQFNALFASADAKAGILAFVNKEKPTFEGR